MSHYIVKKWIEPYVLLETLKSHYDMKDFTFDGFSKKSVKDEFFKNLKKQDSFGLYMKNVNKYYLFRCEKALDLAGMFGFTSEDYEITDDCDEPLNRVDSGKAEAAIIIF